jgi:phosphoribosylamine--glycine ligase
VFHAGTELKNQKTEEPKNNKQIITSGGRVLGVTALGDGIKFAIQNAYRAVDLIKFKGMHYRRDIGRKALKYER